MWLMSSVFERRLNGLVVQLLVHFGPISFPFILGLNPRVLGLGFSG